MSRRRGEFEHRTSIFEGAFRAWSHLGGLMPEDVENKPTNEIDPLTYPIETDPRLASQRKSGDIKEAAKNPDGSPRPEYPYEPLPRSGLAHPYVQAILSPWLGPDADNEAIQLGLTTLRTWWQHRRKGESGSAIAALGTEKMKGVVEGYTRHFFTLAHCLVVNDKEQPPRTLHGRMKELEKMRSKRNKKRVRDDKQGDAGIVGVGNDADAASMQDNLKNDLTDSNLTPLERLHAAQRRQLASSGVVAQLPGGAQMDFPSNQPVIALKGKCIPGKIDLPSVVDAVNHHATQLAHRGTGGIPQPVASGSMPHPLNAMSMTQYGDPNTTPVVLVSSKGDIQISMKIDGITCAHCVKIVETVLRGCNGNKSPIDGLLDAAADRVLNSVLIKIDRASNAKRIAFEAARNLSMVGYTGKVREMRIVGSDADTKSTMDLGALSTAFEVVANNESTDDVFDWSQRCTCPDNGITRNDCTRHSQMNPRIFETFDQREKAVMEYMAGCAMRYGMPCSCGPSCQCKNCSVHSGNGGKNMGQGGNPMNMHDAVDARAIAAVGLDMADPLHGLQPDPLDEEPISVDQKMDFFGMAPPSGVPPGNMPISHIQQHQLSNQPMIPETHEMNHDANAAGSGLMFNSRRSTRNPSIISYGGLRNMSINSETTFGRAMSGLSALSIDWENLEDFDLDVDHSAHIDNQSPPGNRRSSVRRSFANLPGTNDTSQGDNHVSFKV